MAIHNNATTHLQWHNLHLVYSIIDNIVKFQDFILITFSATYLTIIHHNCAFIHHFIWGDCCVSMIHCSSIHCTNSVYSLSIQSDGWLLCLWCYLSINLPQLIHIISHFPPVLMLCLLLHLRIDCCIDAPPAAPIHRRVDCYVLRVQQQLHCTSGTCLVHKLAEVHKRRAHPSDHCNGSDG